jgi:diadenosine tetraphosphate (Ap4A) HIT family hydrolase
MCLFCELSKNAVKENELAYFIYDKFPKIKGHSLIIPKRHIETVFGMTEKEWAAAGELINIAKSEIEKDNQPLGYNVVANCGKIAGQQVMHAHIHLIPRYSLTDL